MDIALTPAERPISWPPAPGGAPYLRIAQIAVYVSNLERPLRFYIDQVGFRQVYEGDFSGVRWVAVAPPDGTAVLSLSHPRGREALLLARAAGQHHAHRRDMPPGLIAFP